MASGGRTAVVVWHRRAGKDMVALRWIVTACLKEPGLYWYVFPNKEQAKNAIWQGVTRDGKAYLSFLPKDQIKAVRPSDFAILFKNGSILKFVSALRPDNLRGAEVKGCVVSEYAVCNEKTISSVIMPMLVMSKGWIIYLYTPSDKMELEHGKKLYQNSKNNSDIFCELLTIEDTKDHNNKQFVTKQELINSGKGQEEIAREFYCDFDAWKFRKIELSTYGEQLNKAEYEGRISQVPHDPAKKVTTYWDVGIVDYTVIWFVQTTKTHIHVIDFYMRRGKDLDFYIMELMSKPYKYEKNVLPHDMGRRQIVKLDTRLQSANERAKELGIIPFTLGKMYHREEMVTKARELIGKCKFDIKKCGQGLDALKRYNASERKTYTASSSSTDVADAFCYMAMDIKTDDEQEKMINPYVNMNRNMLDNYDPYIHNEEEYNPYKT